MRVEVTFATSAIAARLSHEWRVVVVEKIASSYDGNTDPRFKFGVIWRRTWFVVDAP